MHHALGSMKTESGVDFGAWPYIDSMYDYTQILGTDKTIGTIPSTRYRTPVAIIGAGPAGMVAAYEMLRIGLKPVVFEASDRIGGRNYSRPFTDNGVPSQTFAEMGAMYFDLGHKVFAYYANDVFHLPTIPAPFPMDVPTLCYLNNEAYRWGPNMPLPPFAKRLRAEFVSFLGALLNTLAQPWQQNDLEAVRWTWQNYIDRFKGESLTTAMADALPAWTHTDFCDFRTVGCGAGGLGQVLDVGLLDILRELLPLGGSDAQFMFQGGINELTKRFHAQSVRTPDGQQVSLQTLGAVRFNTPVMQVTTGKTGVPLLTYRDQNTQQAVTEEFAAVIVATSVHAMELLGLTLDTSAQPAVIASPVRTALRTIRMTGALKLFIRTETKFWKSDPNLPQAIVTDELPRLVLVFDYPQTENGVVMMTMSWGTDIYKLMGLGVNAQFEMLRERLRVMHPAFAEQLVPMNNEILAMNWVTDPFYGGGWKSNFPVDESHNHAMYYQFLSTLDPAIDSGVYLAGESVAWSGGWTESALHTGLNATAAAIHRVGGSLPDNSPLSQRPDLYRY